MSSIPSTVYVDDIREIKEENPSESMMSLGLIARLSYYT